MKDETTLEALKRLAPDADFSVDPHRGAIGLFVHGFVIEDPFLSECGRFETKPEYYHVSTEVALIMVRHNMECPNE